MKIVNLGLCALKILGVALIRFAELHLEAVNYFVDEICVVLSYLRFLDVSSLLPCFCCFVQSSSIFEYIRFPDEQQSIVGKTPDRKTRILLENVHTVRCD